MILKRSLSILKLAKLLLSLLTIKVFSILKMKKVYISLILIFSLFLLTPISLHQINKKIEKFINPYSQILVQNFQKQIGLEIHWEKLNFKILTMNIHLENVTLSHANATLSKKPTFLNFLNGIQTVQSIDIRPSLFSLIFKKTIVLSRVKIDDGHLNLQTSNNIPKISKTNNTDFDLPIKKIIIKNTNLILTHKNHTIKFIDIDWVIQKKIYQSYHFTSQIKETYLDQEKPFFLKTKGIIERNKIYTKQMELTNDDLNVKTDFLEILFDSKGLQNIKAKSSGSLPFSFINQVLKIFDKKNIDLASLISYSLNLEFNKKKGYKGLFNFKSSEFLFKNKNYKSFSAKGRLLKKTVFIDQGLIAIDKKSLVKLDKIEILFSSLPVKYNLSLEANHLNLSSVLDIINVNIPVKADLNGTIKCIGNIYLSIDCKIKNQSSKITITNWQKKIVSFYDMNTDIDIQWKDNNLNFKIDATKKDTSALNILGNYKSSLDSLQINSDGFFQLGEDIEFNTNLDLKGLVKLNNGLFKINKKIVTAEGYLASNLLKIQNYKLKNINGRVQYKDKQIIFNDLKSNPGKSNYKAYHMIDFNKKESIVRADFSFVDTQDIKESIEPNIKWPLNIKGTGTGSLFIKIPWNPKKKISFTLSGNLFNAYIQKELFQNIGFDISSQEGEGLINNLFFKKNSGLILATGSFNKNFNLNLTGSNIPIESLNFLTTLLPFEQSGLLTLNMEILGPLRDPKGVGSFSLSDTLLYAFPVNDTKAKIAINKKGVTLSGDIMNEFLIEKFYYPFSNKESIEIKGIFSNFDFIKILIAKNQKEFLEKYYSKLKGNVHLFINRSKQRAWTGVLNIENLLISKGRKWLRTKEPFSISFSKKAWILNPVSFFQYNRRNLSIKNNNHKLSISGDTSLSFASILFPNLKNLDGDLNINLITNKNLKKWNPQGTLTIQNGNISINTLPSFSNIKSSLQVDNTKIKISQFKSSIGSGSGSGDGHIIYNFIDPPNVNLSLNFSNIHLNLPKDFLTEGDGYVKITGNKQPYLLSGYYSINSGNIIKNFSKSKSGIGNYYTLIEQKKSQKPPPFQLQFNIETKQPISINNSILNSSVNGKSTIVGPLKAPFLTGNFNISKIKEDNLIIFRDQEFKIISGSVSFKDSPPDNPFINIKAQTLFKEKSIDTFEKNQEIVTEYKIFLTVNGLAKNLNFSLESSPSVDEKEIISMLTLGMRSKYFDENVKENITGYSYHLLGSFLLKQSLNKELKNKLGLDLNISPQINVLNEPVTKITLKKIWFDKLKTSFSRTIEEFPESDIRFKYDLNPYVSLTTFWENTEHTEVDSSEKQKMGLDFEFIFDF